MELCFLGTGTSHGTPMLLCDCAVCTSVNPRDFRLRSSVLLHIEKKNILIDISPDFRQQMLRERTTSIDAILFTHQHKDHTGGLDDFRSFYYNKKQSIPLYARKTVLNQLTREYRYIFSENSYFAAPRFAKIPIDNSLFFFENIPILPIEIYHGSLKIFGFRMGRLVYITDASFIPFIERKKMENIDILIINGLQQKNHISHFSLQEALSFIKKIKPAQAYITHISHKIGLYEEVSQLLPENVYLAYDGLKIKMK